ncbi:hypothetical protein GHT06_018469 [Daphnia sinensis]|uniref:Uncharacterized protein n=1 Tax=Daphnia sinensis TaxID=1820382 RepID=A0AAD5PQV8_9CRUS|nr:hypothetical protein GHT06_018469 [Daphnia sinensis]
MITSVVYWPAKSIHRFEWSNPAGFRQCRPTAAPLSKNPSNLSAGDIPLPESVDYSMMLPISGGPGKWLQILSILLKHDRTPFSFCQCLAGTVPSHKSS